MNAALMDAAMLREPAPSHASQGLALLGAIGLHLALGAVLLNSWTPTFEAPSNAQILRTQLVSLPLPVEPQALPEAPVEPPPEAAAPEPVAEPTAPTEAELAFKRAEQKRVAEAARQQQLRQQRETVERERQAREREQQRLAQEAERTAEARRRIEAERARVAAAEQARREAAAAADRQYLPIAKAPPVYPQRALDSGVQGECTVSYDVDPTGRVVSPQVAGQCHPLFIRPSLEAAKRFRYRPRIVDGQAVTVRGVQNTFHYRIE
ncbi:energy transducer TonB [Stutzerimonas degradans]|uniref:energy transducer TonB n=1 Tax=Stutzerimonas degradans TaxID=2968968 RepID=UPI0013F4F227|nr:energy transducer TonB [Stutzerimonas degradans]NHC10564.1 energy transducer TonB [Stutzerimonas degradans]